MLEAAKQSAAPTYRKLRRLKNHLLNLVDAPVILLAYHRVTKLASDPHQLAVTPENFREQMQYLKQNCRCVRLGDDWSVLCEPAVAVTFDDGYADNVHQALPILEEAGVPATFFISTGTLGICNEFWSDELEGLVLGEGVRPSSFTLQDPQYRRNWPTANRAQRLRLHNCLQPQMLTLNAQQRETWLAQLRQWAGVERLTRQAYRSMTEEELQVLAASPWATIGAHGVTHTPLAVLAEQEQREELARSQRCLEELVGRQVDLFAYPFGGCGQYDRTTRRLCQEMGFRRAVTTLPGQVHRWTDPLQMPRQLVRNWDAKSFAERLESFWT
ncbi:MAG: polysaccharide deacetylase family protein [Desulfuromonadales bacterium]